MKPRIAVTLSRPLTPTADANNNYRVALERAGADVLPIYPGDEVPVDMDGLLLAGGGDIHPSRYGDEDVACTNVDLIRDELEFKISADAIDRDIPILGICRGFQVLNVVRGGRLVQHLAGHEKDDGELVQHARVRPRPGSLLSAASGGQQITVNSRHHQGVTAELLAAGLVATAEVDGLIEAFEATDRRWLVGVQWHPERANEVSAEAAALIDAFVAEVSARVLATAR